MRRKDLSLVLARSCDAVCLAIFRYALGVMNQTNMLARFLTLVVVALAILVVALVGRDLRSHADEDLHAASPNLHRTNAEPSATPKPSHAPGELTNDAQPRHNPRIDPSIDTLEGYEAELLYRPNLEQEGSWVALCNGPRGVLYAADQYGRLYEITPPPIDDFTSPIAVRPLDLEISGAQGLCYAFDSLYVMATGRGLLRVVDTTGDGTPDSESLLVEVTGVGEHGSHGVVVAPDGKSLLFACGNHTPLPDNIVFSHVPTVWGEDQLLPRDPDPRGHANNVKAPGGYICRVQPDGSDIELIAIGFRNEYDIAVSPAGDVFAFDSDMEWDLGLPWYRPTRLVHVVSGADFGWRHGSGKWAASFPDTSPPVVDIGPGSPTGVVFGTGAQFPAIDQQSLFMMDWTYGVMYAVRLNNRGGSFGGEVVKFLSAKALPLTDVVIAEDGAMYFTTGGRRVQSALHRVVYRGHEPTDLVTTVAKPTYDQARRRNQLEPLHRPDAPARAISTIWTQLDDDDHFVRQAARVALELQPVERWRERALSETSPTKSIMALIALARHTQDTDRGAMIESLSAIDTTTLSPTMRDAWARAWTLVFTRLGRPTDTERERALAALSSVYPTMDDATDAQLVDLLVFLHAPGVIRQTLDRMDGLANGTPPSWADLVRRNDRYGSAIRDMLDNPPPTAQLHFARSLSFVDTGWSFADRQRYLAFLNRAVVAGGGLSLSGYVDRMRERHLATCTDQELSLLATLAQPPEPSAGPPIVQPTGPGRIWTAENAESVIAALRGRVNLDRGAGLFRAASCDSCHQINGYGANAGPDLTSAGNTYARPDLLRAIIDPSAAITDQYALSDVRLTDGRTVRGLILSSTDAAIRLTTNFLNPDDAVEIERNTIASIEQSPVSAMPNGLINALSPAELRDLVAYILAGGETKRD